MMQKISGVITRIIYTNPSNHYTVLDLEVDGGIICAVGTVFSAAIGEAIVADGEFYTHPTYGEQFKIASFYIDEPDDIQSIKTYLSSGLIKGIREKKAEDLIRQFGTDVFDVIENAPQRLTEVKGIGEKTARAIHDSYIQQRGERHVVMALGKYGISVSTALKLYDRYGGNAAAVVEKNPYRLIEDVYGIGFNRADQIASLVGISRDSPMRIMAGVRFYLMNILQRGDCYALEDVLTAEASKALGVDESSVEEVLYHLIDSSEIILDERFEERRCYLPYVFDCEEESAQKVAELAKSKEHLFDGDFDKLIGQYETYAQIKLEETQKKAVFTAITNKISVITGGPGTGKTTILKAIIYLLALRGRKFTLAAPTGRAAKKITEACAHQASTIHRLLEYGYGESGYSEDGMEFGRNEDNFIEEDAIIIDEVSMVDIVLFSKLLAAVDEERSSLILVGDKDQLPSVGAGNVLSDLIECGRVPVVRLTQIYRQAAESILITNAHRINNAQMPLIDGDNGEFVFINIATQPKILRSIMKIISENRYNSRDLILGDKMQIITPLKRGDAGVISLNQKLQEYLNPPSDFRNEVKIMTYTLREGDKVMQTKNNYSIKWRSVETFAQGEGIFNGDIGFVSEIDPIAKKVHILFDGERLAEYTFSELENISLAYAITIHKSQGSEFDAVLIPVFSSNPEFLTRNLIYTAVTRAKKQVVLIGEPYVLKHMVGNSNTAKRMSGLSDKIISYET